MYTSVLVLPLEHEILESEQIGIQIPIEHYQNKHWIWMQNYHKTTNICVLNYRHREQTSFWLMYAPASLRAFSNIFRSDSDFIVVKKNSSDSFRIQIELVIMNGYWSRHSIGIPQSEFWVNKTVKNHRNISEFRFRLITNTVKNNVRHGRVFSYGWNI